MEKKYFILSILVISILILSGCLLPTTPTNQTPAACATVYDPVCGDDGRTYSNSCFAHLAGANVASLGECGASQKCVDSDGGRNYTKTGIIEKGGKTYSDTCIDTAKLLEYYCSTDSIANETLTCQSGKCEGGRCVPKLPCSDSDNGTDSTTFGFVDAKGIIYNDSCINPNQVKEYFCQNNSVSSKNIDCQANAQCTGGRCATTQQVCSDTDSGRDGSTKGTVRVEKGGSLIGEYNDTCVNSASVTEYSCSGANMTSEVINCVGDSQCTNGACTSRECSDSDGGKMPSVFGTTTKAPESKSDTCEDFDTVREYYCLNNSIAYSLEPCPSGYSCSAGNCASAGCTDSDNGNDVLVLGVTRKGDVFQSDTCIDQYNILEYFCSGDGVTSIEQVCPVGTVCSEGKCGEAGETCTDSDGGLNFVKGTVTQGGATYTDYCDANGNLVEYFCQGTRLQSGDFECPPGAVCRDGSCVPG